MNGSSFTSWRWIFSRPDKRWPEGTTKKISSVISGSQTISSPSIGTEEIQKSISILSSCRFIEGVDARNCWNRTLDVLVKEPSSSGNILGIETASVIELCCNSAKSLISRSPSLNS